MTRRVSTWFDWRLMLAAAALGLIFAGLTITGALPDAGSTKWVAFLLLAVIGVGVGLIVPDRPLLQGLAAGFLAGLVAIETQAMFLPTYFANNPEYADLEMPFGWPPRVATAVLGPLNAILTAVIAGLLAWVCWRVRRLAVRT